MKISYGTILVFIAFGIMFVSLISKSGSHTSKALIVLVCFILMAFGVIVGRQEIRERIEGQQRSGAYFNENSWG